MSDAVTFHDRLRAAWRESGSLLCVGLDPLPDRLPAHIPPTPDGINAFCLEVADAVAESVCAFKPQFAHFAALGAEDALADLISALRERHPGRPVILDAKRGDIGSTAERYAVEAFERYGADAVTVNPYLGPESIAPFLAYRDRGVIVLCRTSNPGSDWLQDYPEHDPAYLRVARAAVDWNEAGNVMLVCGATYPEPLRRVRAAVGDMPLLVPGIGSQGGALSATLDAGLCADGDGLVLSASRSVLHASAGPDYVVAACAAARALRAQIDTGRRVAAVT